MRWLPQGLPPAFGVFAQALERQFAPLQAANPPRLPAIAQADLTDAHAGRNPFGVAINATSKKVVRSAPNAGGTGFEWKNFDGSAL